MVGVTDLLLLGEILGLFNCESFLLTSLARALLENVCYKLTSAASLDRPRVVVCLSILLLLLHRQESGEKRLQDLLHEWPYTRYSDFQSLYELVDFKQFFFHARSSYDNCSFSDTFSRKFSITRKSHKWSIRYHHAAWLL